MPETEALLASMLLPIVVQAALLTVCSVDRQGRSALLTVCSQGRSCHKISMAYHMVHLLLMLWH